MRSTPRAKRAGLVLRQLDDELLVYDLSRQRAFSLNRNAARLFRLADGTRTVKDLAREMRDVPGQRASRVVVSIGLRDLERHGLLEGRSPTAVSPSRRRWLRRVVAATALPAILGLDARRTSAATCLPPGSVCSSDGECCSGTCLLLVCT